MRNLNSGLSYLGFCLFVCLVGQGKQIEVAMPVIKHLFIDIVLPPVILLKLYVSVTKYLLIAKFRTICEINKKINSTL